MYLDLCDIDDANVDINTLVLLDELDICANTISLNAEISNNAVVNLEGKSNELSLLNRFTGDIVINGDFTLTGDVSYLYHFFLKMIVNMNMLFYPLGLLYRS